jgi:ketosteroid isomerase-like protein
MYSDALSRSDVNEVMRYFTDDAVISINNADPLNSPEQIRQSFIEQFSANELIIEVPLVMAFFADEGNGTAHGNLTIERRQSKAGSRPVIDLVRGVDTFRRTSTGWRCNQRQRTTI